MLTEFDNYVTEAVLEGHPDKTCDQIADAILDEFLRADTKAKVAVECLGTGTTLFVAGEVFSMAKVDLASVANRVYKDIGYSDDLTIIEKLQSQTPQLRRPVDAGAANDQTVVYGYACKTQFNCLPYGVFVANSIAEAIDDLRKRTRAYLPDGKVLVGVRDGSVDMLVLSIQHSSDTDTLTLRDTILSQAVGRVVPLHEIRKIYFNHNSDFFAGGFRNDTGLTGRKLGGDTYCGLVPHGGGSFSGKDPSKIDRSAAYMARFIAKCIVGNGLADSCLVSSAYAFGVATPVMLRIRTGDAHRDETLLSLVTSRFDLRPEAIIERFELRRPIYRITAVYGHFSNPEYPWEKIVVL